MELRALSALPKKRTHELSRLLCQYTTCDLYRGVIHRPRWSYCTLEGAEPRVGRAVHEPLDAECLQCGCAHRAWLHSAVESGIAQAPTAQFGGASAHGKHLRVRGRVLKLFDAVPSSRNDLSVADEHSTNGHLASIVRMTRFSQGKLHVYPIALLQACAGAALRLKRKCTARWPRAG